MTLIRIGDMMKKLSIVEILLELMKNRNDLEALYDSTIEKFRNSTNNELKKINDDIQKELENPKDQSAYDIAALIKFQKAIQNLLNTAGK